MFQILVVEDDSDLNRTVCSFLNQSGYVANRLPRAAMPTTRCTRAV